MLSKFNGTSTPKGSYSAKTGDNDCNINSSRYSLSTALCESIRYQAKSEQKVRQDPITKVRHREAALCIPFGYQSQYHSVACSPVSTLYFVGHHRQWYRECISSCVSSTVLSSSEV